MMFNVLKTAQMHTSNKASTSQYSEAKKVKYNRILQSVLQIPKEEHNQMLRILKDSDPEAVDFLLRRKAANHMR